MAQAMQLRRPEYLTLEIHKIQHVTSLGTITLFVPPITRFTLDQRRPRTVGGADTMHWSTHTTLDSTLGYGTRAGELNRGKVSPL